MTGGFFIIAIIAMIGACIWASTRGLLELITALIWIVLSIGALASCVSAIF